MVLILKNSAHTKKLFSVDHETIFFIKVGIHNDVRYSRFIFQTQKDKTIGRSRTLPCNHASHHAGVLTIGKRERSHARFTCCLDRASRQ